MDVFDLQAKISLNTTEYSQGLQKAKSEAQSLESAFTGAGVKSDLIASGLKAAGSAVIDFGKVAFNQLGDAVGKTMEFDKAMSQVAATMGVSNDALKQTQVATDDFNGSLEEFAQYQGRTTAFTATQAAEALNYMALAGYDAQMSADMLPAVLSLAAAGNMDLARASDMVTDAQSALGLSAQDTLDMADQWAKVSSLTNTSVEQIGEAFLTVGANAKSLKGEEETAVEMTAEMATVLGLMASGGIKAAESGTHLRNIMLKMAKWTAPRGANSKLGWAEGMLGISLEDLAYENGELRDFVDIFEDLGSITKNWSDVDRDSVLGVIFNSYDSAAVKLLMEAAANNRENWEAIEESILGSEGAAKQMAETQLDNLTGDITLLKSAFEGLQLSVGSMPTGILREATQELTDFIGLVTGGVEQGGLAGGFDAAFGYIGEKLEKVAEDVKGKMPEIRNTIESEFNNFTDWFSGDGASTSMTNFTSGLSDAIDKSLDDLVLNIPTYVKNLDKLGTGVIKSIGGAMSGIKAEELTSDYSNVVTTLLDAIGKTLPNKGTELGTLASDVANFIADGINGFDFKSVTNSILGFGGSILDGIGKAVESAKNGNGFNNLKSAIETAVSDVADTVKIRWDGVWSDFTSSVNEHSWDTDGYSAGQKFANGFKKGADAAKNVVETVENIIQEAKDTDTPFLEAAGNWYAHFLEGMHDTFFPDSPNPYTLAIDVQLQNESSLITQLQGYSGEYSIQINSNAEQAQYDLEHVTDILDQLSTNAHNVALEMDEGTAKEKVEAIASEVDSLCAEAHTITVEQGGDGAERIKEIADRITEIGDTWAITVYGETTELDTLINGYSNKTIDIKLRAVVEDGLELNPDGSIKSLPNLPSHHTATLPMDFEIDPNASSELQSEIDSAVAGADTNININVAAPGLDTTKSTLEDIKTTTDALSQTDITLFQDIDLKWLVDDWNTVKPVLEEAKTAFADLMPETFDTTPITNGLNDISSAFANATGEILAFHDAAIDALPTADESKSAGFDFAQGFANGISSGAAMVQTAASALGKIGISALRAAIDSHSPSKVANAIGHDYAQGYADGITEGTSSAVKAIQYMSGQVRANTVGFEDSAIAKTTSDLVSSMFMAQAGKTDKEDYKFILSVDGKALASSLYKPMQNIIKTSSGKTGSIM